MGTGAEEMMDWSVAIQLLAAGLLAIRAVFIINAATVRTHKIFALLWIVTGAAAANFVANVLAGMPTAGRHVTLLVVAATALLLADRRRNKQ